MTKSIVPVDWDEGLGVLTPAQRLFLFYYAQCPDVKWACEQAGCSPLTVQKVWKRQPTFVTAWNMVIRGEVTEVIRKAAADQAAKSFARIIELRDQDSNLRVALDAAQASLRAVRDPTFASRVEVTRDIGENWRRLLTQLLPEIQGLASGDIVEAEDWRVVEPMLLKSGNGEESEGGGTEDSDDTSGVGDE